MNKKNKQKIIMCLSCHSLLFFMRQENLTKSNIEYPAIFNQKQNRLLSCRHFTSKKVSNVEEDRSYTNSSQNYTFNGFIDIFMPHFCAIFTTLTKRSQHTIHIQPLIFESLDHPSVNNATHFFSSNAKANNIVGVLFKRFFAQYITRYSEL